MNLQEKKEIVANVSKLALSAVSVVVVENRGTTVSDMTKLRSDARKAGVKLKVVPNKLAKRAFKGTSFECLDKALVGPTLLAFSDNEPSASARLLKDFVKTNEKLKVTALSLSGQFYSGQHLDMIAKLPTHIEAVARLASVLQAPISKFVRTSAELPTKLVRVFAAVRDQKR